MTYRRDPVKAPRVSGFALRAFVNVIESPLGAPVLGKVTADSGLERFRAFDPGHASTQQVPLPHPQPGQAAPPKELAERAVALPAVAPGEKLETAASFREAYRSGASTPSAVVQRLHKAIAELEERNRMGFFISRKPEEVERAAEESSRRWKEGAPLSALDGVPVVIKDELDLQGFPTTLGTKFLKMPAEHDATVAARLKAAGALILGKANMNEVGINPIGLNPHHGVARNPWDRGHITGGSSSGSASTVAAGLAPISIGADGGGSVRIPAALCGVVGLKATFGRISEHGVPPLCWQVGHVGPLGQTVADVAAAYAIVAGADAADPATLAQPAPHLDGLEERSLNGLRLGICWPYFEDADPDVVARCKEAVRALTEAGATVVEVPPPDLNTILWSHSCIILSEMRDALRPHIEADVTRFALDTRTNLAIAAHFGSADLVHAMRHRTRLTRETLALMKNIDAMVTPTTGITAPPIPELSLPDGESNLPVVDALMRYVRLANLSGLPAISVPAGYDAKGLPVGVQLMARAYEENLLLRMGRVIEAAVPRRIPKVHARALG